jgi:hypothetical protein
LGPFFFHIPNFVVSFKAAEEKFPSENLDALGVFAKYAE